MAPSSSLFQNLLSGCLDTGSYADVGDHLCLFFAMFVVEIFSHPITVCDLIFSFPGLWLFWRYSHIWKSSLTAGHKVFWSPIFYPVLLVFVSVVWIFFHLTKSGCVVTYSHWETGGDSFTEDILWSVPKTKSTFARKKLVFEVSDKNRAPD